MGRVLNKLLKADALVGGIDIRDLATCGLNFPAYYKLTQQKGWSPTSLSIETTYWCNRKCLGCYVPNNLKTESPVIAQKLLNTGIEQATKSGIPFIGFAGGEPLSPVSRSLIYNAVNKSPRQAFFVYTNGDYVPQVREQIKDTHNLIYMVSIDGFEDNHDLIRGKGSFESVITAFKELRDTKKIYGASVTVRKQTSGEIGTKDFLKFLAEQRVKFVRIRTLKKEGGEEITKDETNELVERTSDYASNYPLILNWGSMGSPSKELSGDLLMDINGEIRYTRYNFEESFGNIEETWNDGKGLEKIIRTIRNKIDSEDLGDKSRGRE
jgi:MoaA/NifB/PqqE/SkfB family radical SAM enzyme